MIDLGPAADRMASLVAGVRDDQLGAPTPMGCDLGAALDHVGMFARAFTKVAQKTGAKGSPPSGDNLEPGWRDRIVADLAGLAAAWSDPTAWEGMTSAGGNDLPADVAGIVALDELVLHGWDVAVATGQAYEPSSGEVETCLGFVSSFEAPRDGQLFGPVVDVPASAPAFDRLLGLAGRDPGWTPTA